MNQDEIKKIFEGSLLKADHKFEHPPTCLEISGNYGTQIFATLGNFSTILAPPKVGKTTATGIIVSSLITNKQILNFIPCLPDDKNMIAWIDTEQGKPECVKTIRTISSHTTGKKDEHPTNLLFSSLRGRGREVTVNVIEHILCNYKKVGFLVIDGIRDLVSSINDEKEATYIADKLLRWTQKENIHILSILHQNKGDANARGHLGTELMNKAETVASLSREDTNGKRTTIIEPKFTRHKEFESFAFNIDENGLISTSEVKSTYEPKSPKANQLTSDQIQCLFNGVFGREKRLTYTPLLESIRTNLKSQLDIDFGIVKTKELVKWLKDERYLNYDEITKTYSSNIPIGGMAVQYGGMGCTVLVNMLIMCIIRFIQLIPVWYGLLYMNGTHTIPTNRLIINTHAGMGVFKTFFC